VARFGALLRGFTPYEAIRGQLQPLMTLSGRCLTDCNRSGEVRILTRRTVDLGAEFYDTARRDAEELGYSTASTRQPSQGPDILAGWSDDRGYTACRARYAPQHRRLDRPSSLTRDNPQDRLAEAGAEATDVEPPDRIA
jgi:hypothetical protein